MPRRRREGKKIDYTHWTGAFATTSGQSSGASGSQLINAQHLPETLLRTRGLFTAWLDATLAPGVAVFVTAGLILVPEGTGTTVTWSPQTDADAPWFWWTSFTLFYEEQVTDVVAADGTWHREVIDSRAMRIIKNSEIQLVVENTTAISAGSFNHTFAARFLNGT